MTSVADSGRPAQQSHFGLNLPNTQQLQQVQSGSKQSAARANASKPSNNKATAGNNKKPAVNSRSSNSKSSNNNNSNNNAIVSSSSSGGQTLVLGGSSSNQNANSHQNSFVNFDPAIFLDQCFNTSTTGSTSPESGICLIIA